jgi:hypothetical protein
MKNLFTKTTIVLGLSMLVAPSALQAQKNTIGIAPVEPAPALAASVMKDGKNNQMDQVIQSLDEQLVDRIHNTRKFELVARGDLKTVLTEQAFANSGNVDTADAAAAQQFKLAGAKYVLATKVTGFTDFQESFRVETSRDPGFKRSLSLSATAKIYDSTTGKLYEPASCEVKTNLFTTNPARAKEIAALSDELLVGVARDLAEKVANRVVDVVFPAKVVSKTNKQVTINRGDGTGIAIDQIWNVYAPGKMMVDPDTHEKLGPEELLVGKVKVTSVLPKVSTAEILGEDTGIAEGAIVRMPQTPH